MISKNHGHIVSIASSAGITGVNGLCDYCSSKFGAVGFDESLRMELYALGKTGIHTTAICPFYINTGMFDGVKTRYINATSLSEKKQLFMYRGRCMCLRYCGFSLILRQFCGFFQLKSRFYSLFYK